MRAVITRLGRTVLFVVGLVYGHAGVAHAQSIEFTQTPPATSPATSSPVTVTYSGQYGQDGDCYGPDYCYAFYPYDYGFQLGTFSATLDDAGVYLPPTESENCTYSYHGYIYQCDQTGSATGTLTYGVGTHQLAASVQLHDGNGPLSASTYSFTVTSPVAVVSGGTANVTGGALLQSANFTVQNVATVDGTVFLTASCTGSAIPSGTCASWMREVFVAVGQSVPVRVDFANVAPGGSGTVTLSATDPATGTTLSSASDAVYASASPRVIVSVVPYSTRTNFERSLCTDFAVVPNVANQCGVVRLTHALPSVMTYGKTYTPVLAYYGDFTRGVDLGIDLQIPDAQPMPGIVTYNVYRLNDDGSPSDASPWRTFNIDWGTNIASRKGRATIVDLDFSSSPNRLHNLRVEVLFDGVAVANLNTQVATIYQYYSQRPTREWTLLGLEQIFPNQPGGAVLWLDGDGSTRAYRPQGGGVYLAQSLLGPDSLINDPNGQWHRVLPNHARVVFDALGRHIITQNRYGRQTVFNYVDGSAASALQSITVPGGQSYTFTNTFAQTIVTAPGGRTVTMNHTSSGQGITSFIDPDGQKDSVEYLSGWGGDVVVGAYVDKRGTRTALTWDPCYHTLLTAETPIGNGQTHRLSFDSYNGAGGCGWVWNKADYIVDGARTDVNDESAFWVDSVGAVTQVRNPLLQVTTVEHGDPRFPALPTRVVHPNGFAQSTAYDARGHIASTTSWNPHDDGLNALTRYTWHPTWDEITSIVSPEGASTNYGIDGTTGLRTWQQSGSASPTYFYYSGTFLRAVQPPGAECSTSTTALGCVHFTGDMYENVIGVTTERGGKTTYDRNTVGQIYRTSTLADTVGGVPVWQVEESTLDAMGRETDHVSTGPAVAGASQQQVFVHRTLDATGADSIVDRWSSPDPGGIGHVVNQFRRDALGRVVQEIAADGQRDTTVYDQAGNVLQVTDRNGRWTQFSHDALNRMVSRRTQGFTIDPELIGVAAGLNAPPTSLATAQAFIDAGMAQPYPWNHPSGYAIPALVDTLIFDPTSGTMSDANNPFASVHRTYFPNGQLRAETQTIQSWCGCQAAHTYTSSFGYDRNDRRTSLTYPSVLVPSGSSGAVSYVYDHSGFLWEVSDLAGRNTSFQSDARQRVKQVRYPNYAAQNLTYFDDDALKTDVVQIPGQAWQFRNAVLDYEARGKLRLVDDHPAQEDYRVERTRYDGLGHVLTSTNNLNGPLKDSTTYQLDGLGNTIFRRGSEGNLALRDGGYIESSSSTYDGQDFHHYQPGTGRLWYTSTRNVSVYNDTTFSPSAIMNRYDASGNLVWSAHAVYSQNHDNQPSENQADRRMYYGADGKLWAVDARSIIRPTSGSPTTNVDAFTRSFEEYRYDALGRRILTKFDRTCDNIWEASGLFGDCRISGIRRTIWDGSQELGEIQVPNDALENDLFAGQPADAGGKNLAQFYGAVAYTYDGRLDQPLVVTRLRYATLTNAGVVQYAPFTFYPLWNVHGQSDLGLTMALPDTVCGPWVAPTDARTCISMSGQPNWLPQALRTYRPRAWQGTLLEDKRGAGGLMYRRNRYYDASTGRFTQEDPIGLAGGLNLYGFGGGDPVNYADPLGLAGCKIKSLCDALDSANRWASLLLGRHMQGQLNIPAGMDIPLPRNTNAHVVTRSTITLTRTGDGSSVAVGMRGNVLIQNAQLPGALKHLPDPMIKEAGIDLGSGEFGVKGDVLVGFQVTGNLREGKVNVKIPFMTFHFDLPEDKK